MLLKEVLMVVVSLPQQKCSGSTNWSLVVVEAPGQVVVVVVQSVVVDAAVHHVTGRTAQKRR